MIEGDRAAREALVTCLRFTGAEVHGTIGLPEAHGWLAEKMADVIIVSDESRDALPAHANDACVLMLTHRDHHGHPADEVLRRPIAVSRVVERVEALLQRRQATEVARLRLGDLVFDVATGLASRGSLAIRVGAIETRMLAFFMRNLHQVHTREQLRRLWLGGVRVEARTVDVYAGRIRRVLRRLGCESYLQTVRGSGYRFSDIA